MRALRGGARAGRETGGEPQKRGNEGGGLTRPHDRVEVRERRPVQDVGITVDVVAPEVVDPGGGAGGGDVRRVLPELRHLHPVGRPAGKRFTNAEGRREDATVGQVDGRLPVAQVAATTNRVRSVRDVGTDDIGARGHDAPDPASL